MEQVAKKKWRLTPRFFSLLLVLFIVFFSVYFLWHANRNQLPNLHGWEARDAWAFAEENDLEMVFEFVFSPTVAPTLVSDQSVRPGTPLEAGMVVVVEISKGVDVR